MTRRTIEYLLREHREVEKVLSELESLVEAQRAAPQWTAEHGSAFARILRGFNECVLPHIAKEGEILFPALEGFLPRDVGPLAVLRGEHHDLHANFSRLQQTGAALCHGPAQPQDREDFVRASRGILQAQRDHFYKEERILFPMIARFLSPERDAHLLDQMEAMTHPGGPPAAT